jgi:protein-S-isoprenylcysteine O-methyltransferase Ste14
LTRELGWDLPSTDETCAVFADAFLRAVGFSVLMNRKVRRETIRRPIAAVGSALFFLVGPGVVVGLIPWLLTGWQVREPLPYYYWAPMRVLGVVLLVAGVLVLIQAFVRFVVEGFGTPVPVAAPERLVVGGVYRYVRNPMYVAVLAAIVGQALLLGQLGLLLYAAAIWLIAAAFVRWYEEPTLTRRFGADYEAYRRAVPAWWPRLRPWKPSERDEPGAR